MELQEAVRIINSGEKSQREVAKMMGYTAESGFRGKLKRAGFVRNEEGKLVQLSASEKKNVSGNETSAEKNVSRNEGKSVREKEDNSKLTNERKRDKMKVEKVEPTKEEKPKVRKRASFDIETELLKELRIYAINEEKNTYEIVEQAIKNFLKEAKK